MNSQPREQSSVTGATAAAKPSPKGAKRWWLLIAALVLISLVVGFVIGDDYGMSADEPENARVGQLAARAYGSLEAYEAYMVHGEVLAHHGPSYFMPWQAGSRLLLRLFPCWHITDGRHFITYLTYLIGLASFFILARRLLERRYALLATLLLGTQPMFFGHAFINQKDTPFWVFFLASLVTGMGAVDRILDSKAIPVSDPEGSDDPAVGPSVEASPRALLKWAGWSLVALSAAVVLDVLSVEIAFEAAANLVRQAHRGEAWPVVSRAYHFIAEDADKLSVAVYLGKLEFAYWRLRVPLMLFAISLGAFGMRIARPKAWRRLWDRCRKSVLHFTGAGILLGLAISIRPIAAFAASLVVLYWFLRSEGRGAGLVIPYALSTAATAYSTWPYLWDAPYERFVESALFTGSFARPTRYMGRIVMTDSLPCHYFPNYLFTELTEPAVVLLLLGVAAMALRWIRRKGSRAALSVLVVWVAVPLFGLIALNVGVYGNLRHLLFVVLPLMIIAGLGLQWTLEMLPGERLRMGVILLMLLPGILGLVRLHPYQYTYFNSLVGGVGGAAELHVLDRWCTSYREAMEYVNREARDGALVASQIQEDVAQPFARDDIEVVRWQPSLAGNVDFMLTCSFHIGEWRGEPSWQRVLAVGRGGAVLGEVYAWTGSPTQSQ